MIRKQKPKACQGSGACVEMFLELLQLPETAWKSTIESGKRVKKASVVFKLVEANELEFVRDQVTCPSSALNMPALHVQKWKQAAA